MLRWKQLQLQKQEEANQQLECESNVLEVSPHQAFYQWLVRMDLADPLKPRTRPVDCSTKPALFEVYSDNEEADTDMDSLDDPSRVLALNMFLKENENEFPYAQDLQDHIKEGAHITVCTNDNDDDVLTDVEVLEDPQRALALDALLKEKKSDDLIKVEVEVCDNHCHSCALEVVPVVPLKPKPSMAPKVAKRIFKRAAKSKSKASKSLK